MHKNTNNVPTLQYLICNSYIVDDISEWDARLVTNDFKRIHQYLPSSQRLNEVDATNHNTTHSYQLLLTTR